MLKKKGVEEVYVNTFFKKKCVCMCVYLRTSFNKKRKEKRFFKR